MTSERLGGYLHGDRLTLTKAQVGDKTELHVNAATLKASFQNVNKAA
jgi:hypothetical protein